MYEGFSLWSFLLGLPLGLVITAIVLYITRKKLRKANAYDERYVTVHTKGQAFAWKCSTIAIILAWLYVMISEKIGTAFFVLTFLWLVQMVSYIIGAIVANAKN